MMSRTTQLRVYTIRPGLLQEWGRKWRDSIVPLRRELGFEIAGGWLDHGRDQFVWVISYSGEDSFDEANQRYWASPKRAALEVDPDDYVVASETRVVDSVQ